MSKNQKVEYSPKPGTKAAVVFEVLKSATKPLSVEEIHQQASKKEKGMTAKDAKSVIQGHFMNPIHNCALQRAGIAVVSKDAGYQMINVKPNPNARRERGTQGKDSRRKTASAIIKQSKSAATKQKRKIKVKEEVEAAPRGKSIAEAIAAK